MISLVAAAMTLYYLCAIPIHIALEVRLGAQSSFRFAVSLFEPRFAVRRAQKSSKAPKPHPIPTLAHPLDALSALRTALSHLRIDQVRIEGHLGARDAALTALVCGGLSALVGALPSPICIRLQPDFSASTLDARLMGMVSLRAGHIIVAALLGAFEYGSRRFKEWTSTPLKAS